MKNEKWQDRLFQSDFDRFLGELPLIDENCDNVTKKVRKNFSI